MMIKHLNKFCLVSLILCLSNSVSAEDERFDVYYAGFAFSGDFADRTQSAKYTDKIMKYKDSTGLDVISSSLIKSIKNVKAPNFDISFDMADLDKGDFDSTVMSIVLDNEAYSAAFEPLTSTYLNNVDMYFQILFYNFKSRKLIAAIPFDVEINTLSKNKFTDNDVIDLIRKFYVDGLRGEDGNIINPFNKAEQILNKFVLKEKYRFHIGVTDVIVEDRAKEVMPRHVLNNIKNFKNTVAQSFSSRLSLHQNIALVPFQEGEAIGGKMKQRFANSDTIYDIQLPIPDFSIKLKLRGYKKQLAKSSDVANIYLFGSYVNIKILQPDIKKVYIDKNFKKGNQIEIPNQIQNTNDWRRFYASTVKLFDEFSINISKKDNKWLKFQKSKNQSSNEVSADLDKVQSVLKKVR